MANYPTTTTTAFGSDIVLTNGGCAGIGTTTPAGTSLKIVETVASTLPLRMDHSASTGYAAAQFLSSGTAKGHIGYGNASVGNTALRDKLFLGSVANIDTVVTTNDTARLTVKNDGKVGIGTTSPGSTLEVNGDFKAGGYTIVDSGGYIKVRSSAAASAPVSCIYVDSTSGRLVFKDSGGVNHALY